MGEGGDDRHAPALLSILADSLDCKVDAIKDLELTLCDTQPGAVWGAAEEFVSSPRLDNQVSSRWVRHASIAAGSQPLLQALAVAAMRAKLPPVHLTPPVGHLHCLHARSPLLRPCLIRLKGPLLHLAAVPPDSRGQREAGRG